MRKEDRIREDYKEFEIPDYGIPEYRDLNHYIKNIKKISLLKDGDINFDVKASNE